MIAGFFKGVGKIVSAIKPLDALVNKRDFRNKLAERIVNMRPDYPFEYVLEITTRCNHRCKMCTFKHKPNTNRGDMSFSHYRKIIDELPRNRELIVEFAGGGEPLMHKQFLQFLEYGKKALPRSRFFLSTNGTHLNEEMAKHLIDLELDLLNLGLNSSTKEGHRWLTGADDFDTIVRNGVRFFEMKNGNGFRKPHAFVQIIECKELAHEIPGFRRFWEPIADQLHIRHVIAGTDEGVLESQNVSQIYPTAPVRFPCALPFRCMAIGANGDLFPCNVFSHEGVPWGHLDRDTITSMWSQEKMAALRRSHLEDRFSAFPICEKCDMWNYSARYWLRNPLPFAKRRWL